MPLAIEIGLVLAVSSGYSNIHFLTIRFILNVIINRLQWRIVTDYNEGDSDEVDLPYSYQREVHFNFFFFFDLMNHWVA